MLTHTEVGLVGSELELLGPESGVSPSKAGLSSFSPQTPSTGW